MKDFEQAPGEQVADQQKPCVVLMGEFSAGKSTLCNILLGGLPLPMQVTATRLPPVYISQGEASAFAMDGNGDATEVDAADLGQLQAVDAAAICLTMTSEILEICDLLDMPGISDPNMPADTWDTALSENDIVVWCTHATQAWRQSEAATWERMRGATKGKNILLINQFDKLKSPRDRQRVLNRVLAEVEGKFAAVFPVSLRDALNAGDDRAVWEASGVADFMAILVELILGGEAPAALAKGTAIAPPDVSEEWDAADLQVWQEPSLSATDDVRDMNPSPNVVPIVRPVRPRPVQPRTVVRDGARRPRPQGGQTGISLRAEGEP